MKSVITVRLYAMIGILMCVFLNSVFLQDSFACEHDLARKVADLLVANRVADAQRVLDQLGKQQPSHAMLGFYGAAVLWAKAHNALEQGKSSAQQRSIDALLAVIESDLEFLKDNPKHADRQLSLGMAQAFLARTYLQQGKWFKAYGFGRDARDVLRELIKKHPNTEDAYLILGLYEYYTGSVTPALKWLTALIDLSGNVQLGIQYIERTVQKAPVVAPEAARVLLTEINQPPSHACQYVPLAKNMRKNYPTNYQFSFALQDLYIRCGQPRAALDENKKARLLYLDSNPKLENAMDFRALFAYRELADIEKIESMKSRFSQAPYVWILSVAKTADLIGDRDRAYDLYEELSEDEDVPAWIQNQAQEYSYKPYRRFEIITPKREIKLSANCG